MSNLFSKAKEAINTIKRRSRSPRGPAEEGAAATAAATIPDAPSADGFESFVYSSSSSCSSTTPSSSKESLNRRFLKLTDEALEVQEQSDFMYCFRGPYLFAELLNRCLSNRDASALAAVCVRTRQYLHAVPPERWTGTLQTPRLRRNWIADELADGVRFGLRFDRVDQLIVGQPSTNVYHVARLLRELASLQRVRRLELHRCQGVYDPNIYRALLQREGGAAAAPLEVLVVNGCPEFDENVLPVLTRVGDQLRELTLASLPIRARHWQTWTDTLGQLSAVDHLTRLCLRQSESLLDSALEQLANRGPKQLQWLDLSNCSNCGDSGISALVAQSPQLRHLNISYTSATNATLRALANAAGGARHSLRHLNVSRLQLDDDGMMYLTDGLETLVLACITELTSRGVQRIAAACPRLQSLNLFKCRQVTDDGIVTLLDQCPDLIHLYLFGLEQLTPAIASRLASLVRRGTTQQQQQLPEEQVEKVQFSSAPFPMHLTPAVNMALQAGSMMVVG